MGYAGLCISSPHLPSSDAAQAVGLIHFIETAVSSKRAKVNCNSAVFAVVVTAPESDAVFAVAARSTVSFSFSSQRQWLDP
jgi:hypothetical protein